MRIVPLPACLSLGPAVFAALALCPAGPCAAADQLPFQVPPGFEVSLFANDSLAHDIFSMTVDSHGRVVVAGAGYVKILHDDDGDGRADRAQLYSAIPASGAHGLLFVRNDLICTGDNAVMRLHDNNGDGQANGEPEIWARVRHSEHGANGLIRGPDGWVYLVCGNDAGVSEDNATTESSPVEEPKCGAIVRFSHEGGESEVFAHGFRNPYDLDFNPGGQLFTVDSDGERDHHLPWYAPTRLFDVEQGMEHGWLLAGHQRSWNRPQSFFDNVDRLVEIGRGSPTGVVCYRHRQFPEHYRGGIFSACWTLGTVYYFPLEPNGSTYKSQKEIFLQTTGEIGFSPCDLAVSPEGDLLIAIGGRRTLGSVFRVRYTGPDAKPIEPPATELEQVLAADQPLSSWSRAQWEPLAAKLGREEFEQAVLDDKLPTPERVRAVEVLVDLFEGVDSATAEKIVASVAVDPKAAPVAARIAWALNRSQKDAAGLSLASTLTAVDDPTVQRAAWEAIAVMPSETDVAKISQADWERALSSTDRRVRTAAVLSTERGGEELFKQYASQHYVSQAPISTAEFLALQHTTTCCGPSPKAFNDRCIKCFEETDSPTLRGEALRVLQRTLGDVQIQPGQAEVFSGYRVGREKFFKECSVHIAASLAPAFPTPDAEVNRELARLLGMLGEEDLKLLDALSRQWTSQSTTEDDVHYLIVSALLPGSRAAEVTQREVDALLNLETKLRQRGGHPSQNWPLRVAEMFEELCRRDPALAESLVDDPNFGRPEHSLYATHLMGDLRLRATRKLLAAALMSDDPPGSDLIALVAELPPAESLPALRRYWGEVGLRDAIALALARQGAAEDRERLVESLASVQPKVVEQAAKALTGLESSATAVEIRAALAALRQACQVPEQKELRGALDELLVRWTGGAVPPDQKLLGNPAALWTAWQTWFETAHPDEAKILAASGSVDLAEWQQRLAKLDWSPGDATRGRTHFERKACHRCHQVSGQLGPELTGAVARMSRDDLFAAILDPNKEVSPTFQTTRVITTSGQVYYGLLVYESPEATLLQTAPDTTVRIIGAERSDMQPVRQSLMPTGLLNGTTDQELADLYAYLKTLGKK